MVLMREADPLRAGELADQALAAIGDSDPAARFDALRVRWNASYWVGHLGEAETYLKEQMEVARAAGRKDLESVALLTRAETYSAMLELDEAEAKLERARELARRAAHSSPRQGAAGVVEDLHEPGASRAGRDGHSGSQAPLLGGRCRTGCRRGAESRRLGGLGERRPEKGRSASGSRSGS